MAEALEPFVYQINHDLDKSRMSLTDALLAGPQYASAAPHAVWHVMRVINAVYETMREGCHEAQSIQSRSSPMEIPYMNEFFRFLSNERAYVLKKRRWP